MCNIAGYAGKKQAAPILLEMIRKMQPFDGDTAVGIATIYEGKIHYRKFFGTAEDFIKQTDVLSLPGTIGIAHTHPGINPNYESHQPSLSPDESLAVVANGTRPNAVHQPRWDEIADLLDKAGYQFRVRYPNPKDMHIKIPRTGERLAAVEIIAHYMDYLMHQGLSLEEAMAKEADELLGEHVHVAVHKDRPDSIFVLRQTRSIVAIMEEGETYLATCRFAFPEELKNDAIDLPLLKVCELGREGVRITPYGITKDRTSPVTPKSYKEAYTFIEEMLQGGTPLFLDELESALNKKREFFNEPTVYVEHARMLYDILWQFEKEGRLKKEMRVQTLTHGTRRRWYFWIEV